MIHAELVGGVGRPTRGKTMKISNSKKQLAKIIHENGGWCDGADTCSCDKDGYVDFFVGNPTRIGGSWLNNGDCEYIGGIITPKYEKIKNWHQTLISREEYFHLHPAPDADGWIEWKGGECPVGEDDRIDIKFSDGDELFDAGSNWDWGVDAGRCNIIAYRLHKPEQSKPEFCESVMRSIPEPSDKPTIEQLAVDYRNAKDYANRKQQEADAAKAVAEAKLKKMVTAGKTLGLVLNVAPVQKYTGKFYNAELGETPVYGKNTRDAVCDGCGKRYGEHYGNHCKSDCKG